jgi:hypothetical protein
MYQYGFFDTQTIGFDIGVQHGAVDFYDFLLTHSNWLAQYNATTMKSSEEKEPLESAEEKESLP